MKYHIEDKPGFLPLLMYGIQWWAVAAPSIIVMGLVVAKIHFGSDVSLQVVYMQKLFCIIGLTLLVQVLAGHRLPIVTGPASVLLIGVLASVSSGISAIYTAIFIGGVIITITAISGLLKYLNSIFTTRIITVIMLLIPFTLTPTIIKLIFQDATHPAFNLSFSLILTVVLIILNKLLKGVWKSTTLILGILAGTFIIFLINGHPTIVENDSSFPIESLFIKFDFDWGVILSFLFCAVVLIINEIGSIQALGHMLNADNLPKRNKRGVAITGVSNILSGLLGVMGSVDYTTSSGIISATKAASRFPFIPAAILLIICSFFPGLITILLAIPSVVMGTVLFYIMTSQLTAGLQMAVRDKAINNFNDALVIALPLMVAVIISFIPPEVSSYIPSILRPVISNGFVMGVIFVLILEHFIFRKKNYNN